MDILESLKEEACSPSLVSRTKDECLRELARLAAAGEPGMVAGEVFEALRGREGEGTTALADGVAIPHARLKGAGSFTLGIAVSKKGIKFESPDHKKTHIFFILIGPEDKPEDYLKLLALVSRVAKNVRARRELRNARTVNILKESFIQNSGLVPAQKPAGKMKLFTIVLFEQQYMDDISQLLLERGIRGALVTDSSGVKDVLTRVPLFADFLDFLGERRGASKTISAVVEESEIPALVEGIEEILGDLDTHTGAFVYATDVDFMKGSLEVM
jgi:mannitol/fructose-specific phosphotransferase system IIA component (Ntr-type)